MATSCRPQLGTWPVTQACVLTTNQTGDLQVHGPALNPLSHTSQGCSGSKTDSCQRVGRLGGKVKGLTSTNW